MTLYLCVVTSNGVLFSSEVNELLLPTTSGLIGVLPNHGSLVTAVDIGILRVRLDDQWFTIAQMGGFAILENNEVFILVYEAEMGYEINPQEAQQTLEKAEANLRKAEGRIQIIEANLALRRAKTRVVAATYIHKMS